MSTVQPKLQITAEDKTAAAFASLRSRLNQAQGQSASLVNALAGISPGFAAALSVSGLAALVKATTDGVDALNDVADATGASIENISALESVATRTGATLDDVSSILVKFNGVLKDVDSNQGAAQVLKALGLSADELRRLDPAQALLATAQAFAKFEDNGTKARYMQELFGKSTRQAAAYIKDLADAGQLNATVTAQQAQQAEAFNKQLYSLQAEAQAFARSLTSAVVPALGELLAKLNTLQRGPGLVAGGLEALKGNVFTDAADGLAFYNRQLAALESQAARLRADTRPLVRANLDSELAKLDTQRAKLQQFAELYRGLMNQGSAGAGRGTVNPLAGRSTLPELPSATPRSAAPRITATDRPDLSIPQDLQDALKRLEATDTAKVQRLTDELQRLLSLQASGSQDSGLPQAIAAVRTELEQLDPTTRAAAEAQAQLQALLGDTNTAKLYELNRLTELLNQAYRDGKVETTQYAEAMEVLKQRQEDLTKQTKDTEDAMSVFAEQAQRNIQDALGDTVLATLSGNFDSIEKLWGNMLARMASQAIATQLGELIFGKKGDESSGLLSEVFKIIAGTSGMEGRAYGGSVAPNSLYRVNERGVAEMLSVGGRDYLLMGNQGGQVRSNATATTRAAGGGGMHISFAPVIHIDSRTDQAQVAQLVLKANAESRRQLYRELKATGRM